MKVAVATNDGIQLSMHFGRSAGFLIFEVEGEKVSHIELRSNHHSAHAQGQCDHGSHQPGNSGHSHTGLVGLLEGCEAVLCGGLGAGAAQALAASGIRAVIVHTQGTAAEIVGLFARGELPSTPTAFCGCS